MHSTSCRHSPAHAAALLAWSILPRARLICGAINSLSLRNLLTDFPHACLRSALIMQLLAMAVAAPRLHVCCDGGVGCEGGGAVLGIARLLWERKNKGKRHCVQKSCSLKSAISSQMACVRWVSDADSDAGSASWAVVFKVKLNIKTNKQKTIKIASGFLAC